MTPSARLPRFGLCCLFRTEPITFTHHQATAMLRLDRKQQLNRLSSTVLANLSALLAAVSYCADHDIGCFRVNSKILPLRTHPQAGYQLPDLPDHASILQACDRVRSFCAYQDIRLSFHPDQFTLLSSPNPEVTARSLAELRYHAEIAELIGADVITLHGGGAYGDKSSALARVAANIADLDTPIRSRLVLENDDRVYTPADLLPVCQRLAIPLAYDIHHHRCLGDHLTEMQASELARATWDREPLFHLSSPRHGWQAEDPKPHHELIDIADFPEWWLGSAITVEIEAKGKEVAIRKLMAELRHRS